MPAMTRAFDEVDNALLDEIQQQFPMDHRPFHIVGQKLGISEQECLERISQLKTSQLIRRISATFDPVALGYRSTLAAMKVDSAHLDEAAGMITQHPGVSSVCGRNDPFNLWFHIAVPPIDSLESTVRILHTSAQAEETILLPTRRVYKGGPPAEALHEEPALEGADDVYDEPRRAPPRLVVTTQDIRFIRVLQEDLPLLEMPYAVWAEHTDSTEETLFTWAREAQRVGSMRQFSAVVHPRTPGAKVVSALVVWQVPQPQVDAIGQQMALFREVTCCHQRPVDPHWPYSLFTMIHADSHAACLDVLKRIQHQIGNFPHKHLFNTKVYKQVSIKYFSPELDTWRESVL